MSRLGLILIAVVVLITILLLSHDKEPLAVWNLIYLGILALQAITGVGLLLRARLARIGALVLFALFAALTLWECGKMLILVVPSMLWTMDSALWFANAVATTTLLAWLSFRAIQIVLDSQRTPSTWTPRLLGIALIIVALAHLKSAFDYGFASTSSFSVAISPLGTQLSGFFAWGVWHVAALAIGIALLTPRLASLASLLLMLLVSLVCPLTWLAALRFDGGLDSSDWSFITIATALPLFLAYLSWWLVEEQGLTLRSMSKRQGTLTLAFLAILVAAAVVVEGSQSKQSKREGEHVDAMIASLEADILKRETEENLAATPLHDAIIPSIKVWYCGDASMERGNCDFYQENCEQANAEPCYEQLSAWCFSYRSDELGPEDFACFSTESKCISSRYDKASRCEPYPSHEEDPL